MRHITTEMFRAYVNRVDDEELEGFLFEILDTIDELEQDDYFGTEGFEKRFA